MTKRELLARAANFLDKYSDELGNNGCNDFDMEKFMPDHLERWNFIEDYHEWNGDRQEWASEGRDRPLSLPDFAVVAYIAYLLREFGREL